MDQIITRDLNVSINNHPILKDVNVTIPEKKISVIIGPSGCGKTTLLKSFSRLLDLTEGVKVKGEILVDGEDIYRNSTDVIALRRKMGLLSQKPYPLPLSIFGNVAYGLKIHYTMSHSELHDKVEHYLSEVGLWDEVKDRLHDPAGALSIGQQQRLCLARGLAVEPEIILCDEPTSALDPVSAKRIEGLLVKLSGQYTIVLVTHVLRQARKIADYVSFIYFGEIVEHGLAAQILEDPQEQLTKEYIFGDIGY